MQSPPGAGRRRGPAVGAGAGRAVAGGGAGVDGPGPGVPPFGPTPVTWPLPPSKVTSEQAKKFSVLSERTQRE